MRVRGDCSIPKITQAYACYGTFFPNTYNNGKAHFAKQGQKKDVATLTGCNVFISNILFLL